jgi:type I restriction enzyme S subunit
MCSEGAGTAFAWHTRRFSIDSQVASSAYVYYFLESDFARRYIESVATQTALTGMTTKDYFKTPLLFPCQSEQEKIANIFLRIDRKISLISSELDHAKTFKKGLLQQMFI